MMVLGIFGSIASGKSTARRFFEKNGFFGIDADVIVRELYEVGGAGSAGVVELFGKSFLNQQGSVDRKKLLMFLVENPGRLSELHSVIHPLVNVRIGEILRSLPILPVGSAPQCVVIESTYFDSLYLGQFVDFLLEVSAPRDACFERVQARGLSKAAFDFFWSCSPHYEANFSVFNGGSLEEFQQKLSRILADLL
ncbi:MAG: dephospho-CoA kinase [Patescibacteria group bacterium]